MLDSIRKIDYCEKTNKHNKAYNHRDIGFQDKIAIIFITSHEKSGLTQSEVANKAGIHVNCYVRVERAVMAERGEIILFYSFTFSV